MSPPTIKRWPGGGDAKALRQHHPLRDGECVAQRRGVLGQSQSQLQQLVGFRYIEEAELRNVGRVEKAS